MSLAYQMTKCPHCGGDFTKRGLKRHIGFKHPTERTVEAGASGAAQDAKPCHWAFEDDVTEAWVTGCGNMFSFTDGGPKENEFKYCCYCGGAIDEAVEAQQRGSGT